MNNIKNKTKISRIKRVRVKALGTTERPRLSVFRSNRYINVQIINDKMHKTIVGLSEKQLALKSGTKTEKAKEVGLALAKKALAKKIDQVVFDRGSYRYHGRVKALADGAREGGLKF